MRPEILEALLLLPTLEAIVKALDELVPVAIEEFRRKGGPPPESYEKSGGFIGKILALPPDVIVVHARTNEKFLMALVLSVAVLSFRPKGITLFGRTFDAGKIP